MLVIVAPIHAARLWKPVEQPAASCKQACNRLSNRLNNRLDNRLDVCLHDAAGCLFIRLFNRFGNQLYRVNGVWEMYGAGADLQGRQPAGDVKLKT